MEADLNPSKNGFIALPRTRHTILPYLKHRQLRAELWPELEEFNYHHEPAPLPEPGDYVFGGGKAIPLPENETAWFTLREDGLFRIKIGSEKKQATADIKALMDRIVELIRTHFGGSEQSILLVGHGGNGSVLLKKLVRDTSLDWPKNALLWMVEEQPDGSFRLMMSNDIPVAPH